MALTQNILDHAHMKDAFEEVLNDTELEYDTVTTTQGVYDFQNNLLSAGKEPSKAITLFAFDEYFPAVATTDILCRVSDVLMCKPSELAFYATFLFLWLVGGDTFSNYFNQFLMCILFVGTVYKVSDFFRLFFGCPVK